MLDNSGGRGKKKGDDVRVRVGLNPTVANRLETAPSVSRLKLGRCRNESKVPVL